MKTVAAFLLGFLAYPLVFVPIMAHCAPEAFWNGCVHVYAAYLRLLGV